MMQIDFHSQTLAEILRDLYLQERSGVLELVQGTAEKRIYFDRGMILLAESGVDGEDLGHRLVAEGSISRGALAEARRNISESKDLAETLVNRGLIGREALAPAVRFVVERVIESAFRLGNGHATFTESPILPGPLEGDILFTFEVILKGISAMADFEPIQEALKGQQNKLRLRSPSPVPLERLALSSSHGYVLSRLHANSVAEVVSLVPQGEEDHASRFVYGLLVLGVAAFEPPIGEGPFRIARILKARADRRELELEQERAILEFCELSRTRATHDILGIPADASREAVDAAYSEARNRFRREVIFPTVRKKLRSQLVFIDGCLNEPLLARARVLDWERSPDPREEEVSSPGHVVGVDDLLMRVDMDKTKTKIDLEENARIADAHYSSARKCMQDRDFHNAIQYGQLAVSVHAEDPRAHFLLAECYARNPNARWQRLSEQGYLRAAQLDPWNVEYPLGLGRLYKRRGLMMRARKEFNRALELSPCNEAVLKELDSRELRSA